MDTDRIMIAIYLRASTSQRDEKRSCIGHIAIMLLLSHLYDTVAAEMTETRLISPAQGLLHI